MGLTIKQEKFCNVYIETGNASEAYRAAFSCGKMKDETINREAISLLNNPKIAPRIEELKNELKSKSNITKERVLQELAKIGFSSIAHMHNTWIERVEFDQLTDDQKACIKSITTKIQKKNIGTSECPDIMDVEYVKVELHDKMKALDSISKMLGFNEPDKTEITGMLSANFTINVIDPGVPLCNSENDIPD